MPSHITRCSCGSYVKHIKPHLKTKKHARFITLHNGLNFCSYCKALGHTHESCIYDYVQHFMHFLPKDVVDIIYHFKCDLEYFYNRHTFLNLYTFPKCKVFIPRKHTWKHARLSIKYHLNHFNANNSREEKIRTISAILEIIINYKLFIPFTDWKFLDVVKMKLIHFYQNDHWCNASFYHNILFGHFI